MDKLLSAQNLVSLVQAAVSLGTVILFGSVGEILTEKSGNLNLGVPGTMYMGGIACLSASFFYERACAAAGADPVPAVMLLIAFVSAFAAAAFGGLIYSFLTVTLRTNQNVTGLTLTIFGAGLANFFGGSLNTLAGGVGQISVAATSRVFRTAIFSFLPFRGTVYELFFSYGFLVYLAVLTAIGVHVFLTKTNGGLKLRAVGENPATADAAGISVTRSKYLATCIGTGIAGLGGLFYVMGIPYVAGTWANDGQIENLGWLAVALVIFATWKPLRSIWGSYLFGILYWAYQTFASVLTRRSTSLVQMLPYVVTIIVLIIVSLRKRREDQHPASLGLAYFREER